ncbi:MAG TPA: LacI family transcriptional regulator, partial [Actinobacteria bacterium]|nr:LacI family transcriptional regulator [Actinomycetota bacterium]
WVDVDGRAGADLATTHLLETGHRDIALIGWPEGSLTGDDRSSGYRKALDDLSVPVRPELIVRTENGVEAGRAAMDRLLGLEEPPTAVVAVQDSLALGAMNAIRDAGLTIGRDIAVVGFDDIPSAALAYPPLSSVRQPMDRVGELVVEMLVEELDEDSESSMKTGILTPELIVRASSGSTAGETG